MGKLSYMKLKGSQNLRLRLLLSTLSSTPILIDDIRADATWPGLRPHEVSFLRLLEKVSDDCVVEINETGTKLKYKPGIVMSGRHLVHDCGTSRSIGYFLEPLVVLGLFGKKPLSIRLKGITNDSKDPSVDTFRSTTLPMLKQFGVPSEGLDLKIESRGVPPHGGGQVILSVPIVDSLKVSSQFENTMIHAARGIFNRLLPDVHIFTDHKAGEQAGKSPGYGISLYAETTSGCVISTDTAVSYARGEDEGELEDEKKELSPPGDVGEEIASALLGEIEQGGVVDSTHQGLLFLLCALCPQDVSKVRVGKLAPYAIEVLRHIRDFLGVKFVIKPDPSTETVILKCVGCGLKNLSRKYNGTHNILGYMASVKNGDLPEDVVLEILLRLPVKTLLQLKCVCKRWYALIGSSSFVNQHFSQEAIKNTYLFGITDLMRNDMLLPFAALMGPLNGVFCVVSISGHMALLNPAMRQFKPLPLVHPYVQPHLSSYDDLLGFGLDPSSGDYKLVSIQYFWNEEMDVPHYPSLVSVYNSGSDSWRHFEDVDLVNSSRCAYRSLCNTYLNGVYYWLTEFNDTDVAILAFDMSSEKFQEIQVPDCIKSKEGDLALYDGSIALLSCDLDKIDKCVDVWVMKKEGCWTKILTVGPFQDIKWPLGFWKNSEVLLETGTSLLTLYNVYTQKLRTVEARRKENGFFIYWVFSYKESLVSLKGEGNKCMLWDTSSDFVKDFFK
ncbi:UNVERIFIED_CONTAM: putative RNA 3'-terminal phosphate cyclase-like protein [Sesamum radiatum]|uniref:RNA 3'-terminal phosphate cyclase-like protein n=1 Tax=Sesamum radiatum TaxID=300843 RepID=A0AAW2RBG4_SESRA